MIWLMGASGESAGVGGKIGQVRLRILSIVAVHGGQNEYFTLEENHRTYKSSWSVTSDLMNE